MKRFSDLTTDQQSTKLKADSEYEIAVQNIYADKSLTLEEKQSQKATLWKKYEKWAKENEIWEEVTDAALLQDAEVVLSNQTAIVNTLRTKLGKAVIEIAEKTSEEVTKEVA